MCGRSQTRILPAPCWVEPIVLGKGWSPAVTQGHHRRLRSRYFVMHGFSLPGKPPHPRPVMWCEGANMRCRIVATWVTDSPARRACSCLPARLDTRGFSNPDGHSCHLRATHTRRLIPPAEAISDTPRSYLPRLSNAPTGSCPRQDGANGVLMTSGSWLQPSHFPARHGPAGPVT